jgi:hypothetical protein
MIELRQASKDEMQGDVQIAGNENADETFSKLEQSFIFGVIEY